MSIPEHIFTIIITLKSRQILYWCSWRRQWHPTPVLLPGKSHGWRSLVGCSPWGQYKSDTTEWLHFHFSLSYIGEGNGNPLQCSCLENPRDGGAWWAAVYGVTQSWTGLEWLSSSSSIRGVMNCFFCVFFFKICMIERVKTSSIEVKTPDEKGLWAWLREMSGQMLRYPSKDSEQKFGY